MTNKNQLNRIGDFLASFQDSKESPAFILEAQSSASGMGTNETCTNYVKDSCTTNKRQCINYGEACAKAVNDAKCDNRLGITINTNSTC